MVYGFVKQSGGHIKVYSEEGHGTTIKIYLPRPARRRSRPRRPCGRGAGGGSETILVVEDDATGARLRWSRSCKSLGYRTIAAGNAAEALALVDGGEPFDLLFTDVIMPGGMNGRAARRRDRAAPARHQGAVHVRLHRERDRPPRPARSGRAAAHQAVSQSRARADAAHRARGVDEASASGRRGAAQWVRKISRRGRVRPTCKTRDMCI